MTDLSPVLWVVLHTPQIICAMSKLTPAAIATFTLSLPGPAHFCLQQAMSNIKRRSGFLTSSAVGLALL